MEPVAGECGAHIVCTEMAVRCRSLVPGCQAAAHSVGTKRLSTVSKDIIYEN